MAHDDIITAYVSDDACLTLEELCRVCAVDPVWVVQHVEEGLLAPLTGQPEHWRFNGAILKRTRRMHELERDFDAVPELAALMVDLLEEVDRLRARLHAG